jgi:acetyl esterase/lipase
MYSLDLGHYGTPAESITLLDGQVTIHLPANIGHFEGRLEPAPQKLAGVLVHPAGRFKAVFEPADALPEFSEVSVARTSDVIYRKKHGVALTLDVWKPENSNGIGVISVVSGGWVSAHPDPADSSLRVTMSELFERGFTIFSVVHGSQPYYTIPEIVEDLSRAVRFVRFHAAEYGVDPNRLGITGGSAGCHLSLMQATTGDDGDPQATDPVDRVSSRVQAAACFFPPTDFLNYGKPGENALGRGILKDFKAPFTFREYDEALKSLVPITDESRIEDIGRSISPIYQVTSDDPPTLLMHGDKDFLVPLQQSETFIAKLEAAGVPAKLIVKPGAGHGWGGLFRDYEQMAAWFDRYLVSPPPVDR